MYQAVQHLSGTLQELVLLVCQHDIMRRVVVQDHIKRVVVIGNLGAQATQVEVVLYVPRT